MSVKKAYIKHKEPDLSSYILIVHLLFLVFGIVMFIMGIFVGFKRGYIAAVYDVEDGKSLMFGLDKKPKVECVSIGDSK